METELILRRKTAKLIRRLDDVGANVTPSSHDEECAYSLIFGPRWRSSLRDFIFLLFRSDRYLISGHI